MSLGNVAGESGSVPALRCIGDALSEKSRGLSITFEQVDLIGFALRHKAEVRTETVEVFVV